MIQIPIASQLLDVICRTTGMGFAAIGRFDNDRLIICASNDNNTLNLTPGDQLDFETALRDKLHKSHKEFFIDHVTGNDEFMDHFGSTGFNIQSFASVPVFRQDGGYFGTLFAMDQNPAKVNTPGITGMFQLFANLISFHLNEAEKKNADHVNKLEEELNDSGLREQIIAILGHDLKNPIATMRMSSDILLKFAKEKMVRRQAKMIKSSSFRMEGLIDNILDYAREQMGEGINPLKKTDSDSLQKALDQVVKEIKTISPDRRFDVSIELEEEVNGDENRISQMFSNLLTYADIHAFDNDPIYVSVITRNDKFRISIKNSREKISQEELVKLFQPFYHKHSDPTKIGLNLGLYISSEIAKAHNGSLTVKSTDEHTIFTFSMPLK